MSDNRIEFTTPVGRLIGGDVWKGSPNDDDGKPYIYKTGSRIGQPYSKYSFGVAFEKSNVEFAAIKAHAEQLAGFTMEQNPNFSWKITDGDSQIPNLKGKKPCDREGYPGHWIVWFSGTDAPRVFDQQVKPLTDSSSVKKGYYVRIVGSMGPNGDKRKPGLYFNYAVVQLCGYGEEIVTGIDVAEVLSTPIGAMPAGMSATPVAPSSAPAPAPPAPAPAPPAPAPAPPAPAPAPPAPAPDFAQGPRLLKNGEKYDDYIGAGWTEEQLRQNGLLD